MWLLTKFGFFSIVRKPGDAAAGTLTVRARVKADLEALRSLYLPTMGEIVENAGADYRFRTVVPRAELAGALSRIVLDLDYGNFKDVVAKTQGHARAQLYHKVWDDLHGLQDNMVKPAAQARVAKTSPAAGVAAVSAGGALFDDRGRVLLRQPTNLFDDYVWTFPKGRVEAGATLEETALREVLEETGYRAAITGDVPGSFTSGAGRNFYYLMTPLGEPGPFDRRETQEIRWAGYEEAVALISETRKQAGRKRDLAVLDAAFRAWRHDA